MSTHPRSTRARASLTLLALTTIVTALIALTHASPALAGTTLQVDQATGSDSGNCVATPCRTIAYAVGQAALDTAPVIIDVAAGAYSEDVSLPVTVSGLTISGAGSGSDPATNTVITGNSLTSTINDTGATSFSLAHLRIINPDGDTQDGVYAATGAATLTDLSVDQQARGGDAIGSSTGNLTLNGGTVTTDNSLSWGSGVNSSFGNIVVSNATIKLASDGLGINTRGTANVTGTTINLMNASSNGYGINTIGNIAGDSDTITLAGTGYGVYSSNANANFTNTKITLANPNGDGNGLGAGGGSFFANGSVSVAGSGYGFYTMSDTTIINTPITLTDTMSSSYGVYTAGHLIVQQSAVTVAGKGFGLESDNQLDVNDTTVNLPNPANKLSALSTTGKLTAYNHTSVTVAGTGNGADAGSSVDVRFSTINLTNPATTGHGMDAGRGAIALSSTVTVAGPGSALKAAGNATITDSTLESAGGGTQPAVDLSEFGTTDHTAVFTRSTVIEHSASNRAITADDEDTILDSALVTQGRGIEYSVDSGESHQLTVSASTIDAGSPGVRDSGLNDITATDDSNTASNAQVLVQGSILLEAPAANRPGSVGTVSISCAHSEVPDTSQAQAGMNGSIACASSTSGNSYTAGLSQIFANPQTGYVLNRAWPGVDSVPPASITLPGTLTPSQTDLASGARIADATSTCLPPEQDKGALELPAGPAGVVPQPAINGPSTVTAGQAATFTATASNVAAASFAWQSSDGASATGSTFAHAFTAAGQVKVTMTATGGAGCIATASKTVTVQPAPQPPSPPAPDVPPSAQATPAPTSPQGPRPPAPAPSSCIQRRLTLTDVVMHRGRVLLTGTAEGRLAGQRVTILFQHRWTVATATIGRDGQFRASAPLPPSRLRYSNLARYQARVGHLHSLELKLARRLTLEPPRSTHGFVTLTGQVVPPLAAPIAKVLVWREGSNCRHPVLVARVKPNRRGRYLIRMPNPRGEQIAIYRLSSRVRVHANSRKTHPTFSLTEAVTLH